VAGESLRWDRFVKQVGFLAGNERVWELRMMSVESTEEDDLTGVGRGDIDVHVIVAKCNLEGQITTVGESVTQFIAVY